MSDGSSLGPCPLCGRPMIAGPSVDRHHWVPKSEGGRAHPEVRRFVAWVRRQPPEYLDWPRAPRRRRQ